MRTRSAAGVLLAVAAAMVALLYSQGSFLVMPLHGGSTGGNFADPTRLHFSRAPNPPTVIVVDRIQVSINVVDTKTGTRDAGTKYVDGDPPTEIPPTTTTVVSHATPPLRSSASPPVFETVSRARPSNATTATDAPFTAEPSSTASPTAAAPRTPTAAAPRTPSPPHTTSSERFYSSLKAEHDVAFAIASVQMKRRSVRHYDTVIREAAAVDTLNTSADGLVGSASFTVRRGIHGPTSHVAEDDARQQPVGDGLGADSVRFHFCPREWLYDDLYRYVQSPIESTRVNKPRLKNGELRLYEALFQSLYSLGCELTVERDCTGTFVSTLQGRRHARSQQSTVGGQGTNTTQPLTTPQQLMHGAGGPPRYFIFESQLQHVMQENAVNNTFDGYWRDCVDQLPFTYFSWFWHIDHLHIPAEQQLTPHATQQKTTPVGLFAECPFVGAPKEHYAVLWGKRKQTSGLQRIINRIEGLIPVVSVCVDQCHIRTTYKLPQLSRSEFMYLMARARVVLGLQSPANGPTALEAISCGTPVIAVKRSIPEFLRNHPLTYVPKSEDALVQHLERLLRDKNSPANAPNATERYLATLPPYYTREGHRRNLVEVFGLDSNSHNCRPRVNKTLQHRVGRTAAVHHGVRNGTVVTSTAKVRQHHMYSNRRASDDSILFNCLNAAKRDQVNFTRQR